MRSSVRCLVACVAGAWLAAQAGATTIETTSYSTWTGGLTGSPVEADFTQLAYRGYDTSAGVTLGGVGDPADQFTFTGPDNGSYVLNGQRYNGILSLVGAADTNAGINVAFSRTGQTAFLVSIGSTSGTAITLALSDGESFSVASGVYGFSVSHPITSFFLSTTSTSQPVINDFYYGVSSMPQDVSGDSGSGGPAVASEGVTLVLVLGGGLTLLGARRKLIPMIAAQ